MKTLHFFCVKYQRCFKNYRFVNFLLESHFLRHSRSAHVKISALVIGILCLFRQSMLQSMGHMDCQRNCSNAIEE